MEPINPMSNETMNNVLSNNGDVSCCSFCHVYKGPTAFEIIGTEVCTGGVRINNSNNVKWVIITFVDSSKWKLKTDPITDSNVMKKMDPIEDK